MKAFTRLDNQNRGEAIEFLEKDPGHAVIMLYDIVNVGMDPGDTCIHGHYFGKWDDSGLVAIAAYYSLGSLFIWAKEKKYLAGIGEYVAKSGIAPHVIGGEFSQIEYVMSEMAGRVFNVRKTIDLDLMCATQIDEFPSIDMVEPADISMLDELIEISKEFEVEQFGESSTSEEDNRFLHRRHIEDNSSFVIKRGGKVVSRADGLRVSGVYGQVMRVFTIPTQRSKGYATACVARLCREVLMDGSTAYLEVMKDNAPAIRAYEKVGFKKIAERKFVAVGPG